MLWESWIGRPKGFAMEVSTVINSVVLVPTVSALVQFPVWFSTHNACTCSVPEC